MKRPVKADKSLSKDAKKYTLTEVILTDEVRKERKIPPPARAFRMTPGGVFVFCSVHEQLGKWMAIKHSTRFPSWEEVNFAVKQLVPMGTRMGLIFPYIPTDAVNTFYLYEIKPKEIRQDAKGIQDTILLDA